jgi:hypothetical protein
VSSPFFDFYRCPEDAACFTVREGLSAEPGYFRFEQDIVCFGRCSSGSSSRFPANGLYDSLPAVSSNHSSVRLPFDLAQVIDNLRLERYLPRPRPGAAQRLARSGYYFLRPILSVSARRQLQKLFLRGWEKLPFPYWPVDTTVEQIFEKLLILTLEARRVESIPFIWFWPEGALSCVMMTHDVESLRGAGFCQRLMQIDQDRGIPSSFQIVPEERYAVTRSWLASIRERGFEVNVHDLNHDGRLFDNRSRFLARAKMINEYVQSFGGRGYRSALMYRNPDWYDALDISYDMSIPNNAHLEPQRGGCCTVFPYFIGKVLELPLTTTQDYSLLHILNEYSIELWKREIDLIRKRHGLISFIVHPDYIVSERARDVYLALLDHIMHLRSDSSAWVALPGDVDEWWRARARMRLVLKNGQWAVEGSGSERARVAFAQLENGVLDYAISNSSVCDGLPPAARTPHLGACAPPSR